MKAPCPTCQGGGVVHVWPICRFWARESDGRHVYMIEWRDRRVAFAKTAEEAAELMAKAKARAK